jgi:hypothetical protein
LKRDLPIEVAEVSGYGAWLARSGAAFTGFILDFKHLKLNAELGSFVGGRTD